MKKKLLSLLLLAGMIVGCRPTDPTNPTTDPSIEDPTTQTNPSVDPTEPSVDPTEPSVDPTEPSVDPTEPSVDPTDPSVDPTDPSEDPTDPSTDDPIVPPTVHPEDIKISETPEAGTTRLYFMAPNFWHDSTNYSTSIITDTYAYPGVRMYRVGENEDSTKLLYAFDINLSSTSTISFAAFNNDDVYPGEAVGFLDVTLDTNSFAVADLNGHNLFLIHDEDVVTGRSLNLYTAVYEEGVWDYVKPELPDNPDNPDTPVEKKRIYFMDRDWWNYNGAKTSFYYWNSATDVAEFGWPGVTAFLEETIETDYDTVVNVYYADIDLSKYDSIIFNRVDGSNPVEGALANKELKSQTADIKISAMGENNMVILTSPEPVKNVSGETCATMFGVYEPGKWDFGHITGAYVPPPVEEITLYFRTDWASVNAYVWNDLEDNGWPGQPMTKVEGREDNLYSFVTNNTFENVIFNDGGTNQTGDISLTGYSKDKPYWSGTAWTVIPEDGEIETYEDITVYVKTTWASVNFYTWNAVGYHTAWPGTAMNKVDGHTDLYTATISSIYTNIIFNNGTSQTADLNLSDWSEEKPCFHIATNRWDTIEGTTPDVPVEPGDDTNKVYFITQTWWQTDGATTSFYYWGGTGVAPAWPGYGCTLEETLSDGRQVWSYSIDVTTLTGFIFVRTSSGLTPGAVGTDWGAKTADLTSTLLGTNNCIVMTSTTAVWGTGVQVKYATYVPGQTAY